MNQEHSMHRGHPSAHHHDRGFSAVLRYTRLLEELWRSEVNSAVVQELALRPQELVVDLGAGAGAATVEAARTGAQVLAVDPMPFMRAVLRLRRLAHGGRRAIDVRPGAAESIPASAGSVDALWTVNTLHHWIDREAGARELARVLKPGGRVLLIDEDFEEASHPQHPVHQRRRHKLHFDEVDPAALATALKREGFHHAEGTRTRFAGRPVKCVRAIR